MTTALTNRRYDFIKDLYRLGSDLSSPVSRRVSDARRVLAHLRRGLSGEWQDVAAYEFVFRHDPPQRETPSWTLIAGLFALHPVPTKIGANVGFGAPMGMLAREGRASATRRFTQLLGQNPVAFPHYLRQSIQLLARDGRPVDYRRLLDDVVILTGQEHRGPEAQDVRLSWIREFHRHADPDRSRTTTDTESTSDSEETTK